MGQSSAADEQRRARQAALDRVRANASLSTPDDAGGRGLAIESAGGAKSQRKDRSKNRVQKQAQKQPPKPPRAPVYREPEEGEGDSAPSLGPGAGMLGAARASAPPAPPTAGPSPGGGRSGLQAAELRAALRNPSDIRRALILGEILGAPRSARPF